MLQNTPIPIADLDITLECGKSISLWLRSDKRHGIPHHSRKPDY